MRWLVLGFGNPCRLDDGLGPAFAARLEDLHLPDVTVDASYQPMVEDAAAIAEHDGVLFVDAAVTGAEPFYLERVTESESGDHAFTTHSVAPGALLALARQLCGASVPGVVMGIRGYTFDAFGERLSPLAQRNLDAALRFAEMELRRGQLPGCDTDSQNTPRRSV